MAEDDASFDVNVVSSSARDSCAGLCSNRPTFQSCAVICIISLTNMCRI